MSFDSLLIHQVTIYNPTDGAADRYGNPTITLGTGVTVAARMDPIASDETLQERDTRVTSYRCFLKAGTVIDALAVVEWEGKTYRVKGEPARYSDSIGEHHVEAVAEIVEG